MNTSLTFVLFHKLLHQVPPLTSIASVPIKPDHKTSSSARSGKPDGNYHNSNSNSSPNLSNNSRHTDILTNTIRTNDISSGCSRTIPISWTSAASSSTNNIVDSRNIGCSLLQVCYPQQQHHTQKKKTNVEVNFQKRIEN